MQNAWFSDQQQSQSLVEELTTLWTAHRGLKDDDSNSIGTYETLPPNSVHVSNIDLVLDILFIFLMGVAIIVGLILIIYAAVVLFDRFCGCSSLMVWSEEEPLRDNHEIDGPSADAYGPVAYKARLWGLTTRERRAVLDRVFAAVVSHYTAQIKVHDGHLVEPPFNGCYKQASADLESRGKDPPGSSDLIASSDRESSIYINAPTLRLSNRKITLSKEKSGCATLSVLSDGSYKQESIDLEGGGEDQLGPFDISDGDCSTHIGVKTEKLSDRDAGSKVDNIENCIDGRIVGTDSKESDVDCRGDRLAHVEASSRTSYMRAFEVAPNIGEAVHIEESKEKGGNKHTSGLEGGSSLCTTECGSTPDATKFGDEEKRRVELESSIDAMLLDERRLTTSNCAICLGDYGTKNLVIIGKLWLEDF